MKEGSVTVYHVYSPWLRIFHWVMVLCVFTLFATGLYIGNPGYIGSLGTEPTFAVASLFSMESIRYIHFAAAWILMGALVLRIYGFVINKGDRLLPKFWTKLYWEGIVDSTLHYLFIRRHHTPCLRNSLARTAYLAVYAALLMEAVTGFAMYFMVNSNGMGAALFGPFNHLFVDEYVVHLIHHYVAWCIIIFVVAHVYLAFRADMMEQEGEISSMFSGVKFMRHEPADIGDIVDGKDHSHSTGGRQHPIAR